MNALVPIILLILAGGTFFGYVDNTYTKVKELQKEKATYDEALENAKKAVSKFESLQQQYNSIPLESVEQIKRFLPDNIDNIRLIIDLNGIALRHGMTLKTIAIDGGGDTSKKPMSGDTSVLESGIGTVGVSFSVNGSYDNFLAFIKDIEKSMRLVDVSSISVSTPVPGKTTSQYNVSVKTYWLK